MKKVILIIGLFISSPIFGEEFIWTERNPILSKFALENKEYFLRNQENIFIKYQNYSSFIEGVAKKYNVPVEIAYLPAVESGYRSNAVSYAGATGMWQFMYSTAKDMDLKVNSNIDERKNWKKSTIAGVRYIKWLSNELYGDYELAILAYNAGIGKVKGAIKKYNTRDPWILIQKDDFKEEQKEYLPRYLTYLSVFEKLKNQK